MVVAQRPGRVLGEGVAVSLPVRGSHEGRHHLDAPLRDLGRLPPQIGEAQVDVELQQVDSRWTVRHVKKPRSPVGRHLPLGNYHPLVAASRIRLGPARLPSREKPEHAVALLVERGYTACELDFESGFWMDYPWAEALGAAAQAHDIALSVHAPLFAFPGHPDERKAKQALGALDRSAGLASAAGAELVVIHPGFWLGRERPQTLDDVVRQLEVLWERLERKERTVAFGVEVMGRVRELGSLDDVLELARRVPFVRPVLDFAHLHATSDGAFTDVEPFADALAAADAASEPDAAFHIHFSDIAYANRNETKHLPYGAGTLRAEPLAEALAQFTRSATVISESPDERSTQAIGAVLGVGTSSASRSS